MKIGLRTIKTAIGAGASIWIAQLFGLQFSISAAIITILCLQKTKKRSIQASLNRFFACTLGLAVSSVFFELLGYHPWVLTLYILCFMPLLVKLKIQDGFVTSVVVVLHIFTLKRISTMIFIDEFIVIFIGIGMAILMNSYMPKLEKELKSRKEKIENQFKEILYQFGLYIDKGDQGWDGKEVLELEKLIKTSKTMALEKSENHVTQDKRDHYHYFDLREKQFEILKRMLPIVSSLTDEVPQRPIFAQFLYDLSEDVKSENTAQIHLNELKKQRMNMKTLELPTTREEFETRASLFHLMNEMEYYLETKIKYYQENKIEV